jgi:DnaA family protein
MANSRPSSIQLVQGVLTLTAPAWPKLNQFIAFGNESTLASLEHWLNIKSPSVCWLLGEASSGKTHLAQALLSAQSELGEHGAFVSGKEAKHLSPEMLQGLELLPIVCIDDVDALLIQPSWLLALTRLSILIRDRGGCLMLVQKNAHIPDSLQGLVLQLMSVEREDLKRDILVSRSKESDIQLSDVVVAWLLKQFGADLGQLMHVLDYLDHASMTLKRPITVPFAKQVLLQ